MRREVRRAVTSAGTRRQLVTRCWVGHPGGPEETHVVEVVAPPQGLADRLPAPALAALRADLVERAVDGLDGADGSLCWVVREGPLDLDDLDVAWWGAAVRGFARHGLAPAGFCLVARHGWRDVVSGHGRTWSRLRA